MGFLKQLQNFSKSILIIGICSFSSLTLRPRRSFALEPLPIIKILNENENIEIFEFDIDVSPGKKAQAIIHFRNRSVDEQLIYDQIQLKLNQTKEKEGRYSILRMLESSKRFDDENKINVVRNSLNGANSRFLIREELPIDSLLRKDHYVNGKLVKGITHRTRPPYFEVVENKLAKENNQLIEKNKQLLFENKQLLDQINKKK